MRREGFARCLAPGAGIALLMMMLSAVAHTPGAYALIAHTPVTHTPVTHTPVTHTPVTHTPVTYALIAHAPMPGGGGPQRTRPSQTAGPHHTPRDAVLGGPSQFDARRLVRH
jgi:hypothetical protein